MESVGTDQFRGRRLVSVSALTLVVSLAVPLTGNAATRAEVPYPTKPLRFVVPYSAGGGGDIMARMIGAKLTEAWGQPVIVDNRPGGGTIIGTDLVAKAPPDGYTILLATNTHAVNASLHRKLPYDSLRDFAPVTLLATAPNILLASPSLQTRSLGQFVALAKSRPGKLNYGSSGKGGTGHLAMEMLKSLAKIDLVHIPYKGGGPAMNAILGGEVSVLFNNIIAAVPQVKAGRLWALGVTSRQRSLAVPDVPTIAEGGVQGFEATAWFSVLAPAGTPRPVITKVNSELARILKLPEVGERLSSQGAEPVGNSPEEFAAVMRSEISRWKKVIEAAGIVPE